MSDISITIGNYRILSIIASGSFGRVYLARHTVITTRLAALKLMHELPFSSDEERKQFLQEAQVLELLKHPYILPVLDAGIHEGIPYIVSEFAAGSSLRKRLQDQTLRPLSLEESMTILSQVGQALQYAHDQNVIHRDIKPENILFHAQGHALLADFGLATAMATASVKQVGHGGTPRYMAPEQFREQVRKASDQYALGCVAYELLTGHAPFLASSAIALLYQHVSVPPTPLRQYNPYIPEYLEQAVLRALMKQPDERHKDVRSFVAALQGPGQPQSSHPTTVPSTLVSLQAPLIEERPSRFSTLPIKTEQGRSSTKEATQLSEASVKQATQQSKSQIDARGTIVPSSAAASTAFTSGSVDEQEGGSHPQSQQEDALPSRASHNQKQLDGISRTRRRPRSRLLIIAACIATLIAVFSGSVLWVTRAAPSTRGNMQQSNLSSFAPTHLSTATAPPTLQPAHSSLKPTQTAKPGPTPAPASQPTQAVHAASTPQPAPTHQAVPVSGAAPKRFFDTSYYVCGDQATLTNLNAWNAVAANSVVHASGYSGPVDGYAGPGGNPKNSPGNCSGNYEWAWNQNSVQAQWTWSNAHLPNGSCNVSVHIPSWYAGAPDAHYTLMVTSNSGGSTNYPFDTQDQNQPVTTWLDLHMNGQVPSLSLPGSSNGMYTLALTLKNGGTPNWYLGADAIRFNCSSTALQ